MNVHTSTAVDSHLNAYLTKIVRMVNAKYIHDIQIFIKVNIYNIEIYKLR